MKNFWERREEMRQTYEKYGRRKGNRLLRNLSFTAIGLCIADIGAMIILFDRIPVETFLFMRGLAGLFAIISICLIAVYLYRINSSYWHDKIK